MIIEGQEPRIFVPKMRYEKKLVRDFNFPDSFRFKLVLVWRLKSLERVLCYDGS